MSEVKVDTISERTAANGVAVDGVTIKDSGLTIPSGGTLTVASGATIDASAGTATGFGGDNTPAFSAYLSSDQTGIADATMTTIVFQTEYFDTDSAYDTSNGRFTVPSGEGGKYWVSFNTLMVASGSAGNAIAVLSKVLKNGSTTVCQAENQTHYVSNIQPLYFGAVVTLSAGDYIEVQGYVNTYDGSTVSCAGDAHYRSYFGAYKMIGV